MSFNAWENSSEHNPPLPTAYWQQLAQANPLDSTPPSPAATNTAPPVGVTSMTHPSSTADASTAAAPATMTPHAAAAVPPITVVSTVNAAPPTAVRPTGTLTTVPVHRSLAVHESLLQVSNHTEHSSSHHGSAAAPSEVAAASGTGMFGGVGGGDGFLGGFSVCVCVCMHAWLCI